MAFAHGERAARYDLAHVATRARRSSGGFVLDGDKCVVLHAPCADRLVVSARTAGNDTDADGISLFLVDAHAPGLAQNAYRTIDGMPAADIALRERAASMPTRCSAARAKRCR